METRTPGIKAMHRIVTDECRAVEGSVKELAAIAEVLRSVEAQLDKSFAAHPVGKDTRIHVVVTVEYKDASRANPDNKIS
jgi:hypothetical protein